jgi:hypothetical protein
MDLEFADEVDQRPHRGVGAGFDLLAPVLLKVGDGFRERLGLQGGQARRLVGPQPTAAAQAEPTT